MRRLLGRITELWVQGLLYMYGGGLEGREYGEDEEHSRRPVVTEFDWIP